MFKNKLMLTEMLIQLLIHGLPILDLNLLTLSCAHVIDKIGLYQGIIIFLTCKLQTETTEIYTHFKNMVCIINIIKVRVKRTIIYRPLPLN